MRPILSKVVTAVSRQTAHSPFIIKNGIARGASIFTKGFEPNHQGLTNDEGANGADYERH